jgi:hypothetical protein
MDVISAIFKAGAPNGTRAVMRIRWAAEMVNSKTLILAKYAQAIEYSSP